MTNAIKAYFYDDPRRVMFVWATIGAVLAIIQ